MSSATSLGERPCCMTRTTFRTVAPFSCHNSSACGESSGLPSQPLPRRQMFPGWWPGFAMNELMLRAFAPHHNAGFDRSASRQMLLRNHLDRSKKAILVGRRTGAPAGLVLVCLEHQCSRLRSNPKAQVHKCFKRSEHHWRPEITTPIRMAGQNSGPF